MIRSYKFRIYPNKAQKAELTEMLAAYCWLYNQALRDRIDAYKNYGWNLTYFQQSTSLKYMRQRHESLGRFSAVGGIRVLRRLDHAFQDFFRRLKSGEKPGYPRFRPAARFDSVQIQYGHGIRLQGASMLLVGIPGAVKVKMHRQLPGTPKGVVVKREGSRWFLICQVEVEAAPAADRPYSPVGIDAGLTYIVAMTTGETVATPQFTAKASKRIRKRSRAMRRAVKDSNRRRKARERLGEAHRKAARQRRDFLHKLSRRIIDSHSHVAIEDLSVSQMTRSRFGKSIHNAAWGTLRAMIESKAEEAGSIVLAVNPRGTSQACSGCGAVVQKDLKVRTHDCPHCSLVLDRDLNAARNILRLADFRPGIGHRTRSEPVAA